MISLPYSKSMFMRAATITATRRPRELSELRPYADCDDSRKYLNALITLMDQVGYDVNGEQAAHGVSSGPKEIYIGDGATPARFLTALAAAIPGSDIIIKGSEQLGLRPISPLVDILRETGADIEYLGIEFSLPLHIHGKRLDASSLSPVDVETSKTSQYLSAMLLTSPLTGFPIDVPNLTDTVSASYISMTLKMMEKDYPTIEYDWSAASFFYEAALALTFHGMTLSENSLVLPPLSPPGKSLQGDSLCSDIFAEFGVATVFASDRTQLFVDTEVAKQRVANATPFERDMSSTPDLVPPVAIGLTFCGIPYRITGITHLQYKESSRMHTISHEMRKLGYDVRYDADSLSSSGGFIPLTPKNHAMETYSDHRLAMAFAPLLHRLGFRILNSDAVGKSFPGFWDEFLKLEKK